jgi:hypothetical protein
MVILPNLSGSGQPAAVMMINGGDEGKLVMRISGP